jgi:transposase InsO family protein
MSPLTTPAHRLRQGCGQQKEAQCRRFPPGRFRLLRIKVERVMTDNGSCYKSFAFLRLCNWLGLGHFRTKSYTPRTNGKAERFIRLPVRVGYVEAHQHSQHAAPLQLV